MGRMKEKFLDEQQRRDAEMQNKYFDDDYCCNQQCGCHEENKTSAEDAAAYAAEVAAYAAYEAQKVGLPYNSTEILEFIELKTKFNQFIYICLQLKTYFEKQ